MPWGVVDFDSQVVSMRVFGMPDASGKRATFEVEFETPKDGWFGQ